MNDSDASMIKLLARSVEDAVFQCLLNAQSQPDKEEMWRKQADKLEQKFTTQHGWHYSHFTERTEPAP